MGGRGDMSPYFLKWRGCPVFCPPPTFSGVDIFCNAQLHSTDYINVHHSFRLLVATVYRLVYYLIRFSLKFNQLILRKIIKIASPDVVF